MHKDERAERVSQAVVSEETNLSDLYEAASAVARRVLESSQKIAGTTYCKGVQIAELAKWAKENGWKTHFFLNLCEIDLTQIIKENSMRLNTWDCPRLSLFASLCIRASLSYNSWCPRLSVLPSGWTRLSE